MLQTAGLHNNMGFIEALSGKRVVDVVGFLEINPTAAQAVYNCLGIREADMVDPHTFNVGVKRRDSTALALIFAFQFPAIGSNVDLVRQLQELMNELRLNAEFHGEYGVVVRRVYNDTTRNHLIDAQLRAALDLPAQDWMAIHSYMTVTVPAFVAVAKLLLL